MNLELLIILKKAQSHQIRIKKNDLFFVIRSVHPRDARSVLFLFLSIDGALLPDKDVRNGHCRIADPAGTRKTLAVNI